MKNAQNTSLLIVFKKIENSRSSETIHQPLINLVEEDNVNPPHISMSSSELSPQSSLPSHTHVWSLHKVLLQMNSSARQKKAPAIPQTGPRDFYTVTHLEQCILCCGIDDSERHNYNGTPSYIMTQTALDHLASQIKSELISVFHPIVNLSFSLYLRHLPLHICHDLFSFVWSLYKKCFITVHRISLSSNNICRWYIKIRF